MSARSLKQALRLDLDDLLRMNMKELGEVYRQLGAETRKRVAVFEKHGAGSAQAIRRVKDLPKSPRRYRKRELARKIFDQQLFLSGDDSSYSKYKKNLKEFRKYQELKTGIRYRTMKQFERYSAFIKDVAERWSSLPNWYEYARRLFAQSMNVGFDIRRKTFLENFDYWAEHVAKMEQMTERDPALTKQKKVSVKKLMDMFDLPPIPEDGDE